MDEAQKAVEPVQAAAPVEVKPADNASISTVSPSQAEYEALLAENAKIREERENYRKGMLKAKGKLKQDPDDEDVDEESLIERKVREVLLAEKESLAEKKHNEFIKSLIEKNKEMALALQNKANMPNASAGSGQVDKSVADPFFTPEQLADLKKKGLDPEKVKANMLRTKI